MHARDGAHHRQACQAWRRGQACERDLKHGDAPPARVVAAVDLVAGRVLQFALAEVPHHLATRLEE